MAQERARLRLVDVAEEAGVSIAAASRALSGSAGVSDVIAQRVREVAERMGYVANVHARTLAAGPARASGCSCTRSATPTSPRSPAVCCGSVPGRG
ncbi:LacI family DNA-binding transcriptional regulator [Saccharopolyspora erythraea]|uniref:LacI family DNA-binding transcriptional regulator n=1 Tax=Saccharopolyspora erythraea TaxID=1836 RepID=UPI0004244700|nr:LacI family DNA-binding transcriptional regulator [Saccharopolyspora erythraea]